MSQLTPEEVNEDKTRFAEILLEEADHDLARAGLVLDTLKVQNVTDERGFLDSIGRIRSAEVIKIATISEAEAHAKATIKDAINLQRARLAEIQNRQKNSKLNLNVRFVMQKPKPLHWLLKRKGRIQAQVARATADIKVQKACVEQIRQELEANLIEPSKAEMQASIATAKGDSAKIIEDGKATVAVLSEMIATAAGGENARDIFLMQKLQSVMSSMVSSIESIEVDKVTVLPAGNSGDSTGANLARLNEEVRASVGVDIPALIEAWKQGQQRK